MLSVEELAKKLIDTSSFLSRDAFTKQYLDREDIAEAEIRYDQARLVANAVAAMCTGQEWDDFEATSSCPAAVCRRAWDMAANINGAAIKPQDVDSDLSSRLARIEEKLDMLIDALADDEEPDVPTVQTLDGGQAYAERDKGQSL